MTNDYNPSNTTKFSWNEVEVLAICIITEIIRRRIIIKIVQGINWFYHLWNTANNRDRPQHPTQMPRLIDENKDKNGFLGGRIDCVSGSEARDKENI